MSRPGPGGRGRRPSRRAELVGRPGRIRGAPASTSVFVLVVGAGPVRLLRVVLPPPRDRCPPPRSRGHRLHLMFVHQTGYTRAKRMSSALECFTRAKDVPGGKDHVRGQRARRSALRRPQLLLGERRIARRAARGSRRGPRPAAHPQRPSRSSRAGAPWDSSRRRSGMRSRAACGACRPTRSTCTGRTSRTARCRARRPSARSMSSPRRASSARSARAPCRAGLTETAVARPSPASALV